MPTPISMIGIIVALGATGPSMGGKLGPSKKTRSGPSAFPAPKEKPGRAPVEEAPAKESSEAKEAPTPSSQSAKKNEERSKKATPAKRSRSTKQKPRPRKEPPPEPVSDEPVAEETAPVAPAPVAAPEPSDPTDAPVPLESLDDAPEPAPSLSPPSTTPGPVYAASGPPVAIPTLMRPEGLPTPKRAKADPPDEGPPGEESAEKKRWVDDVSLGAFADAYAGVNASLPEPQSGTNAFRAFDVSNGFALHWAALDVAYDGDQFGAAVGLRFGPGASIYNGADGDIGLEYVKQAYGSWLPKVAKGRLRFDLGKFDTLYGAEVADSQANFNYTRGALNWLGQPFFHTGLRANIEMTDKSSLAAIVVNGWNNSVDNNFGKTFGLQLGLTPSDKFSFYLGYLGGPENDRRMDVSCDADTAFDGTTGECVAAAGAEGETVSLHARNVERRFRHFADVIVAIDPTPKFSILGNADVGHDEIIANPVTGEYDRVLWWGASLAARYRLTDHWAAAARGEFYHDPNGFTTGAVNAQGEAAELMLGTGTFTLEFSPIEHLILKLDSRYDRANRSTFQTRVNGTSPHQLTFTLGAVVTTG